MYYNLAKMMSVCINPSCRNFFEVLENQGESQTVSVDHKSFIENVKKEFGVDLSQYEDIIKYGKK